MASFPLASHLARYMPLFFRPQRLNIRCSSSLVTTPKFDVKQGFGTVASVEENKEKIDLKPRSVSVRVAYEFLQAGYRYLDVRTSDEFYAVHPREAINIPYYLKIAGEEMVKNSKFLEKVSSEFEKENKMVVGCKSGRRSLLAATDLQVAGFTHVTDVAGGYTAWKENGLPVSQ